MDEEDGQQTANRPSSSDSNAEIHSQFSEEEFQRDLHKRPRVVGPGGVLLPQRHELTEMLEDGSVSVMCFTWNIAAKSVRSLEMLSELFSKMDANERPDVIAIALQELPTSTLYVKNKISVHFRFSRFHRDMVAIVEKALNDTHRVYCWVRKWSQMVLVFMRRKLSLYASCPEYQFIATKRLASPFRTKGAIGICFRLLQTTCVFIACHLTHGKLKRRISDYHKLSRSFDFEMLRRQRSSDANNVPIKKAANVFWFGDLNFRLWHVDAAQLIKKQLQNRLFRHNLDFRELLDHDELTIEKAKGFIFENFREGVIAFPPTHKFIRNSNQYAPNRIPSIVCCFGQKIKNLRYDCIWDLTVSDHKPVYCTFKMRVYESKSSNGHSEAISLSNSTVFDSTNST
ncbi:Endonuclease/exonuclease/phosphatase family protein [Aphelenchoides besseyi]|nr:Endonuclease/exonuclease/phosphatase family protein [Aphelenchoides besseyi]